MASPFSFTTGNDHIVGKIDFSVSRNKSGYTVSYNVFYRRTNSWSGYPTSGTISYNVYVNGSVATSGSKSFTVPNSGSWVSLVSGSKTIGLDALKSSTFTIGYSSTNKTSGATVTAFNCSKKTSSSNTVSAYAGTLSTKPTITGLVDNGNNTFSFNFSTPKNPTNNPLTNTLTTTTEGDNPTTNNEAVNSGTSGSRTKEGKSRDNPTFTARISLKSDPTYGNTLTVSSSKVINYWKAPGTQPLPTIQPMRNNKNISKITPKCTLRCQWDMAPVGNSNSSALNHNGCRFYFLIKRRGASNWETFGDNKDGSGRGYIDVYYEDKTTPLTTLHNSPGFVCYKLPDFNTFYIDINSETYNLQKGDKVQVIIQPFTTNVIRDGSIVCWVGVNSYSGEFEVESAGIINIKQSANSWCEGQVYIKTASGWLEADSVYVKDSSGWKESI